MTSSSAAPTLGGTGSVLLLWSGLVIVIGGSLFAYGMIVVTRERRRRKRNEQRRAAQGRPARPRARDQLSGAAAFPSSRGTRPIPAEERALPGGRRPLALPAAPHHAGPPYPPPPASGQYYGQPYQTQPAYQPAPSWPRFPEPLALPAGPSASVLTPTPTLPVPASGPPGYPSSAPPGYPTSAPPGYPTLPVQVSGARRRKGDCSALRAECERLREHASNTAAAAAQAAVEAHEVYARYEAAHRLLVAAQQSYDAAVRESAATASAIAALEQPGAGGLEETTHAAFAAYRRGDISAEQLREVFRRAEGWTPEHDRLSREANQRKAEEAEAQRTLESARMFEQSEAEQSRIATVSARALDEESRALAEQAQRACGAADECEQGRRR